MTKVVSVEVRSPPSPSTALSFSLAYTILNTASTLSPSSLSLGFTYQSPSLASSPIASVLARSRY